MEEYLGEIRMFGGNFAPRNWAFCEGQLLPINQYQSLYSLLGTTYGGDGRTTFALPDLRGRAPIHAGDDHMGNNYPLGQKGGQETVNLTVDEMPAHNHEPKANAANGVEADPTGRFPAEYPGETFATNTNVDMGATTNTGGGQSHNNMMPYQATCYIICISGMFPSRN